jgi:hypothetical protein
MSTKEMRNTAELSSVNTKPFEWKEAPDDAKPVVYTVYGEKGVGKTYAAMTVSKGKTYVLSFDGMSNDVRTNALEAEKDRIVVVDILDQWDRSEKMIVPTAVRAYDYIIWVLNEIQKRGDADAVVLDGLEIFMQICEMVMRHDAKLGPFDAFSNLNLWKKRNLKMQFIHALAKRVAKEAVIYTTYTKFFELDRENGEIPTTVKRPKWADEIEWQTKTVLEVTSTVMSRNKKTLLEDDSKAPGARFFVTVVHNKRKSPKTGMTVEITNRPIYSLGW